MDLQTPVIKISFPVKPAYVWLVNADNNNKSHTDLLTEFSLDEDIYSVQYRSQLKDSSQYYKCTVYVESTKDDGSPYFSNAGTTIFLLYRNDSYTDESRIMNVPLKTLEPIRHIDGTYDHSKGWERCSQVCTFDIKITSLQVYCIRDLVPSLENESRRVVERALNKPLPRDTPSLKSLPNIKGFIPFARFDFDTPFPVPGGMGNRFMDAQSFMPETWLNLVYVALCICGFNYTKFVFSSTEQKEQTTVALLVVALGSSWTAGYEHEEIDDTSPVWSSLGTNKDCEDFSITFVSLLNSLLNDTIALGDVVMALESCRYRNVRGFKEMALTITKYAKMYTRDACMVSGWINRMHEAVVTDTLEGHAWGAFLDLKRRKYMFVECTCPVLPHTAEGYASEAEAVDKIYGGALVGPLSDLSVDADYYGPATFQPVGRYLCAAIKTTNISTHYLSPKKTTTIGVKIDKFISNDYNLNEVCCTEVGELKYILDVLRFRPVFKDIRDNMESLSRQLWEYTDTNTVTSTSRRLSTAIFLSFKTNWTKRNALASELVSTFPFSFGALVFSKSNAIILFTDKTNNNR